MIEVLPLNPISQFSPLEFTIGPFNDRFIDTSSIRLYGQLCLRKVDATGKTSDTTEADDVSVISQFPLGCFKSLSVLLNDCECMDLSQNAYPFKCYVDSMCSFDPMACPTVLSTQYFTKQTMGSETNNKLSSTPSTDKSAFAVNRNFVIGKTCEFLCGTYCEMFNSQRLLIPGVQIKMKYLPSETEFPLLSVTGNR